MGDWNGRYETFLVSYDQDMMFGKGLLKSGTRFDVNRFGEIEPGYFGTRMIGQGRDGKGGHG